MRKSTLGILSSAIGVIIGSMTAGYLKNKEIVEKAEKVDKFKSYYNLLNQWLVVKNEGKSLEKYFIDQGYKTIAIYGMGEMGNRLYDELKGTSIEVKYAIDKNADSTYSELKVLTLEDTLDDVDVVVVTAIFAFDEINDELTKLINSPIISLEDIIYEI